MNLECQVCTGNKIATSFHNLDDLQAHFFGNHLEEPLDVFQFVCHNCEFKFATEYRLLRHEQTCGRQSRCEEDMEKIRYKVQMYELLEESLKYNMTKHQTTSSVPPANPSNIETSDTRESPETQWQTESLGVKRIKFEIPESRENPVSNARQENSGGNGSAETTGGSPSTITNESSENSGNLRIVKAEVKDQNCSNSSATNTQSNVKTEPEDVDTSEPEILGSVEPRKRKAPSKPAEHISHRSEGIAKPKVKSEGESSVRWRSVRYRKKQAKASLDTSNTQPSVGGPLWKQYLLGSANVNESQIPNFNSIRDQEERRTTSTSTAANLTNKSATGLGQM
ncbi:hypothetical protein Ddc_17751 [Ditylenchus destructor]|nr:hypothetical protein Ddc_17751 [Ditylenchus destructor]